MESKEHQYRLLSWEKWRLLGLLSLVLVILALAILALDPNLEGIRRVIRVTARTSLALFLLAFTASAAWQHFPNAWTRWQRQNRRYLGLGFVVSHVIHAAGIAAYATLFTTQFRSATEHANLVPNFVGYGFILLMALTSFDRTAAMIGPRAWKILHTAGIYYLWISFTIGFGKRIPQSTGYVLPVLVLAIALGFRLWPASRQQSGQAG